jgi:hypothetical protein
MNSDEEKTISSLGTANDLSQYPRELRKIQRIDQVPNLGFNAYAERWPTPLFPACAVLVFLSDLSKDSVFASQSASLSEATAAKARQADG